MKQSGKLLRLLTVMAVSLVLMLMAACGEPKKPDDVDPPVPPDDTVKVSTITFTSTSSDTELTGTGSKADPYVVKVPYTQYVYVYYSVAPNDAQDKTINIKYSADSTYGTQTDSSDNIGVDNTGILNVRSKSGSESGGAYYFSVNSTDGGASAYAKVEVTEFSPIEELSLQTANSLQAAEDENAAWDYEFSTMAGTNLNIGRGQNTTAKQNWQTNIGPEKLDDVAGSVRYYYDLYDVSFVTNEATNSALLVSYYSDSALTQEIAAEDSVVRFNAAQPDGKNVKLGIDVGSIAGTSYIKIASVTNPEVFKVVKVTAEGSFQTGIFQSDWDSMPAVDVTGDSWDFDKDFGENSPAYNRARLGTMRYTIINSNDSNNNKVFYMGNASKPYGFSVENYPNSAAQVNSLGEVVWTKVNVPATATFFRINIGTNDRLALSARVLLVDPTGELSDHSLLSWTDLVQDDSKRNYGFTDANRMVIPEEWKGRTAAIVIEAVMTANTNTELQVKGLWIDTLTAVESVRFGTETVDRGQTATFTQKAEVLPSNATNKSLIYSVTPADSGVTVDNNGNVTIDANATVGAYTITAVAVSNDTKSDSYTLNVSEYRPVKSIMLDRTQLNGTYHAGLKATSGNGQTVYFTDGAIRLKATVSAEGGQEPSNSAVVWTIVSGAEVIGLNNGLVTFLSAGTALVRATSHDNPELYAECTVIVTEYSAASNVEEGVYINTTEAESKSVSDLTAWNNSGAYAEWTQRIVGGNHTANKIIEDGSWIRAEAHTNGTDSVFAGDNKKTPSVVVWNKVSVPTDAQVFAIDVAAHNDANQYFRFNYRIRVMELNADGTVNMANAFVTVTDWTSVAKAKASGSQTAYTLTADMSAYQGKTLLVLIEGVNAWRDDAKPSGNVNGNGWMWIRNLRFGGEEITASNWAMDWGSALGGGVYSDADNTITIAADGEAILPAFNFDNYVLKGLFRSLVTIGSGNVPTVDATGMSASVATYDSGSRTITAVASGETAIRLVYKSLSDGSDYAFTIKIIVT